MALSEASSELKYRRCDTAVGVSTAYQRFQEAAIRNFANPDAALMKAQLDVFVARADG